MVSIRNLAIAASSILSFVSAAPTIESRQDTWVPGTLNNTREFYLHMTVTDGDYTHNGWVLEAWHTGAGMADPVFVDASNNTGSRMYFNSSQLQFDVSPYPFSINAFPSDTNYARWEPVTITAGYGSGKFVNEGSAGFQVDEEEADGWVVCEWFHGLNAPQLFQMIKYFDAPSPYDVPSSCARVLLFPVWI
ncbi:hypothetical protein BOTCAL_0266g00030 [Botryotinia calthae]|uniref:DUF7907 domain-containing protein n=1 Tax=Botryotinia calthae TaxID=38488 RepID=A0A4Y8CYI2_9HELO|nr:hypothetical protein BOTCAL_0266g00030 [Botryotinia calthae]